MREQPLGRTLQHLRRLAAEPAASDAQLLRRFVDHGDESAFELLVWRHGPMVHGLCRRVLRGPDAEDAFQATLLVLARKARSIGKRESVGSWLYKVAYRVALRARESAARRARHERTASDLGAVGEPHVPADPGWEELRPILDEELGRLAERHRAPVVLCYLEGLTNEEAARALGCPVGTIKTRLAQARRLLGTRLADRGLALAAGFAAGMTPLAGAVPPALVTATVRAAASAAAGNVLGGGAIPAPVARLMEGVVRAMTVLKLKWAAAALALALAAVGVGSVSLRALAGGPTEEPARPPAAPAEARVKQLRAQIADLNRQLREAEEEAASKKEASPPRDRPIAVIFGDVPVTREEVAEHLLARMSAAQLERYLNLRILEHAAGAKGVRVTDAEVDAYLGEEMRHLGVSEQTFREQVLGKHRLTLREWQQDVARPQLLLRKLAAASGATEAELRAAYEARHGEKVECRVIVVDSEERAVAEGVAGRIRSGEVTFEKEAERRRPGVGAIPVTIPRQPSQGSEALVKAAFVLKPGEVSPVVEHNGRFVLLECLRRVPADTSVRFEDVREALRAELVRRPREDAMSDLFKELKAAARLKLLWTPGGGER